MSLEPDIKVTRQAIDRLVNSLTGDPQEQATIAASAAFTFIANAHGEQTALDAFLAASFLGKDQS